MYIVLFKFLLFGSGKLLYYKEKLLLCRGDNDTFGSNGRVKRMLIDFEGYLTVSSLLNFDSRTANSFLSILKREHSLSRLLWRCTEYEYQKKFNPNLAYLSRNLYGTLSKFAIPIRLIALSAKILAFIYPLINLVVFAKKRAIKLLSKFIF